MVIAFLLASIEFSRAIDVNHSIQEASQAACRIYSVRTGSQEQADAIISTAMTNAGVDNYTVTYSPSTKDLILTHMEPVTVTIVVEFDDVGFLSGSFLNGRSITAATIMPADLEIIEDYVPIDPIDEDDPAEDPDPDPDPDDDVDDDDDDDYGDPPWWWPWWWDWPPPWL